MSSDPTGPQEVKEHLNFVERLLDGADSSDEYLEAIVRNQAVMIGLLEDGGSSVPEIGTSGVPKGTAGIAISGASENDFAEFLYKDDGRTVVRDFVAARDVAQGEVATVTEDGEIIPAGGVKQGDLDFGNIATSTSNAGEFIYADTPDNVTILPGESEKVLEVNLTDGGAWYTTGTNDETYSLYQYYVDGEELLQDPIPKPLGLYNNMFEFPEPLKVNSSIEVEVTRQPGAPGSEEYFSNLVVM